MNRQELVKELVARMQNANVEAYRGGVKIADKYFEEVVKEWYLDCGDFGFAHRQHCTWDILVEYLGVTYKGITHDEDYKKHYDFACEVNYAAIQRSMLLNYWEEWKEVAMEEVLGDCQAVMNEENEEED